MNISEDLQEVTGNKIIHIDQTYYERTDIQDLRVGVV